jgi:phosphopantetheine--protein transferase-like protein
MKTLVAAGMSYPWEAQRGADRCALPLQKPKIRSYLGRVADSTIETRSFKTVRSVVRDLCDLVRPLLPDCVEVVEGPIADEQHILWPEEAALIAKAVPKRRAEFACGRLFAHRAIRKFNPDDGPLLPGTDRAPIWPPGLIGSISHSHRYCAAAVARKSHISAIGIDVEEMGRFRTDLTQRILSAREIEANLLESSNQERLARMALIFSAKESLYKCLNPLTRAQLGFHDVEVVLRDGSAELEIRLQARAGEFDAGYTFVGRYAVRGDLVATAVTLSSATA